MKHDVPSAYLGFLDQPDVDVLLGTALIRRASAEYLYRCAEARAPPKWLWSHSICEIEVVSLTQATQTFEKLS